ncbi:hypothetical protein IPH25_04455 [bacterium]|nr:MAG: hypothetical protein IPG37_01450 [bacterium]QQR61697.1 MAG: hypothetical protein IPH25_04455 [bacterium]
MRTHLSFGSWSKKNAKISIDERYRSLFKELFFLTTQAFGRPSNPDKDYLFLQQFVLLGCNEKNQLKNMFSLIKSEANVSYLKNKIKLMLAQNYEYILNKLKAIIDENKELIHLDNSSVNAFPLQHRLYLVQVFLNEIVRYGGHNTDIFPVQDLLSTAEQYALIASMLQFYDNNKATIAKLKAARLKKVFFGRKIVNFFGIQPRTDEVNFAFLKEEDANWQLGTSTVNIKCTSTAYQAQSMLKLAKNNIALWAKMKIQRETLLFYYHEELVKELNIMNNKNENQLIWLDWQRIFELISTNAEYWQNNYNKTLALCKQYESCKKIFKFWCSDQEISETDLSHRFAFVIFVLQLFDPNTFLDIGFKPTVDQLLDSIKNGTYDFSKHVEKKAEIYGCFNTIDDLKKYLRSINFTDKHSRVFQQFITIYMKKTIDLSDASCQRYNPENLHSLLDKIWPTILKVCNSSTVTARSSNAQKKWDRDCQLFEQCKLLFKKILCGQFCTEPPAAQNNPSIERAAVVSAKSRKQYLQLRYHILRANQFTHALFSKPLDELVMLKKVLKVEDPRTESSFLKKAWNTFVSFKLVQNLITFVKTFFKNQNYQHNA